MDDTDTNPREGRITRCASLVRAVGLVATAIGGGSGMLRTDGAEASAGGPAAVVS